ncbi:MAG: FadR/GntR family transcriptional regulator [Formivibrio sp.]|nr:FadR/GntR family transcriptional regulator [Formivibrio sp.]
MEMQSMGRRETLSGKLIRAISDRIAAGQYRVGDRLPSEQEMIEEFGVSRTVVREAIANLKAGGSVSTVQGVGAFVMLQDKPSAFEIKETSNLTVAQEMIGVLELRVALETEAVALAAQRRSETNLATMREALEEVRYAATAGVYTAEVGEKAAEADIAFHRAIAEATGNSHFLRLFNYLGEYMVSRSRLQTFKFGGGPVQEYLERTIAEHERIYQAIAMQDTDTARAALRLHLAGSRDRLQRQIAKYAAR